MRNKYLSKEELHDILEKNLQELLENKPLLKKLQLTLKAYQRKHEKIAAEQAITKSTRKRR